MIRFVLNNQIVSTEESASGTLLDFIRYHQSLSGTKIGCREGDCGACTILIGSLNDNRIEYQTMTSCITPLGNAEGKHIVTVEGLNMEDLSPVQNSMVVHNGSQCGFCTPGFVVSLSWFVLSQEAITEEKMIGAIDGNICRCTGYKSIIRAGNEIIENIKNKNTTDPVKWAAENGFIPEYFLEVPEKLKNLSVSLKNGNLEGKIVGGGTDLYVQMHDDLNNIPVRLVLNEPTLKGISVVNENVVIGAANTVTDLMESESLRKSIPGLYQYLKLVSSTPIRNMGTLAGNFVNASPIGDLTAFFIALDARIVIEGITAETRKIFLHELYLDYKKLNKSDEEIILSVEFKLPSEHFHFNFEKISKRKFLDIASVNTAIGLQLDGKLVKHIRISAGGVGPTPRYLKQVCEYFIGNEFNRELIYEALVLLPEDIAPISDARGTKEYKTMLLRQLIIAHFIELFPEKFKMEDFI